MAIKTKGKTRVILVGLDLQSKSEIGHDPQVSLQELRRLAETLDYEIVASLSQARKAKDPATLIGIGKLQEIAKLTAGTGEIVSFSKKTSRVSSAQPHTIIETRRTPAIAGRILIDEELSPTQLRNWEHATGVEVWDRSHVIIEIFSQHARTKAAKIQVEIARLKYMAPRLRLQKVGEDRQRSGRGIGASAKGVGETSYELDRRKIAKRISELEKSLENITLQETLRSSGRAEANTVALVGYTNAGKSSVMEALTGSPVLVEDKLFATLDTTVRVMQPETATKILITDTVGFIRKLPHDLVASFRSTLSEAVNAALIVFVVDASDSDFRNQLSLTRQVLTELRTRGAECIILNKIDLLTADAVDTLRKEFPEALMISAKNKTGLNELRAYLQKHFEGQLETRELHIPYAKGKYLNEVRMKLKILTEAADETGFCLEVEGPAYALDDLENRINQSPQQRKD